ncbi:MAG TPA: sigma-70 family RNA polymerase sigma factor [Clostridia bacterium]|nr:sigma-70 family RNA polymerase sigma factor [Clostridia bacterium]
MLMMVATLSDEITKNKFEQIYTKYSRYLYAIGLNILADKECVEDAMQQSFLKIFKNIDKLSIVESKQTKSFVSIIMRNESINIYNKNKAIMSAIRPLNDIDMDTDIEFEDKSADVEDILARAELKSEMHTYINELNMDESNLIILKYVREYSSEEISGILNVSQEVVRQRLFRAKRKLACLIIEGRKEA